MKSPSEDLPPDHLICSPVSPAVWLHARLVVPVSVCHTVAQSERMPSVSSATAMTGQCSIDPLQQMYYSQPAIFFDPRPLSEDLQSRSVIRHCHIAQVAVSDWQIGHSDC